MKPLRKSKNIWQGKEKNLTFLSIRKDLTLIRRSGRFSEIFPLVKNAHMLKLPKSSEGLQPPEPWVMLAGETESRLSYLATGLFAVMGQSEDTPGGQKERENFWILKNGIKRTD